jgi:hypothetical protein
VNRKALDALKKEGMRLKLNEACRHALFAAKLECEEASKDNFKKFRTSVKKVREALEDAECLLNELDNL